MGNLLGWIRGLWEDRGERRNVKASSDISSDVHASSVISSLEENVKASSDISSDVQASSGISSLSKPLRYEWPTLPRQSHSEPRQYPQPRQFHSEPQPTLSRQSPTLSRQSHSEPTLYREAPPRYRQSYEWLIEFESYIPAVLESPVEETARSVMDTSAKSEILDIIRELKQKVPGIQATRACFNPENTKFEITVVSKRPNEVKRRTKDIITERISRDLDYDLEVRKITEEGITVTNSEEFIEFFADEGYSKEIFKLQRVISKHSDSFMKNDPNITCISFSPVKSTGYGTPEYKIVKEPCIVFFVQVKFDKKRIPLDSKRIPEIIEDIKTDVREGIVETLMQAPQDASNIELGCPISSVHRSGTLGPIVSTEHNTSGFLTSLHVLFSLDDLKSISKNKHTDDEAGLNTPVFKKTKDGAIGKVIKVYFANGNEEQSKPGYEVGLVELHRDVYIEEGNVQANGLAQLTGETTAVTEDNCENRFKKLGAETGITNAIYKGLTSTYFKYEEIDLYYLCCQIELLSIQYNEKKGKNVVVDFAQPGDSGAMVTIKEEKTDKIVGIFTGKRSDNVYLITPIQPICDRLQEDGWKICGQRNQNNNGEQMDTS